MRLFLTLLCVFCSHSAHAGFFEKIIHFFAPATYTEEKVASRVFAATRTPDEQSIFIFSPKEHTFAVYNKKGKRVALGRATGGKDFCPDVNAKCRTVVGKFKVFRKEDKHCTSHTFPIDEGGGAPMPYCMFFHEGYAIHGSDNVSNHNISHGCVRVSKKAAKWLHQHYIKEGSYVQVMDYA